MCLCIRAHRDFVTVYGWRHCEYRDIKKTTCVRWSEQERVLDFSSFLFCLCIGVHRDCYCLGDNTVHIVTLHVRWENNSLFFSAFISVHTETVIVWMTTLCISWHYMCAERIIDFFLSVYLCTPRLLLYGWQHCSYRDITMCAERIIDFFLSIFVHTETVIVRMTTLHIVTLPCELRE